MLVHINTSKKKHFLSLHTLNQNQNQYHFLLAEYPCFFFLPLQTNNTTKVSQIIAIVAWFLKDCFPFPLWKKEGKKKKKQNALEAITLSEEGLTVFPICQCTLDLQHPSPHPPFQNKTYQHIQPYWIPLKDTMKLLHIQTAQRVDLPIGPFWVPLWVLNAYKCYIWKWNGWFCIACTFPCPWHVLYDKKIHPELEISS